MRSVQRGVLAMILCGGGVTSVVTPRLAAQDVHELERRLVATLAQRDSAASVLAAFRSRPGVSRAFPDTVSFLSGAVRIYTDDEFVPLARDGGARAEAFIRERAGNTVSSLTGIAFGLWTDSAQRAAHGVVVNARTGGNYDGDQYLYSDGASLARYLEAYAQERLGMRNKSSFSQWLTNSLPLTAAMNADWRQVRVELVSSTAAVARHCFDGALAACKATLGLVTEPDPAVAWYDAAGRRAIVTRMRDMARFEHDALTACMGGNDAECTSLIRTHTALVNFLAPPGSAHTRGTLVQEAFRLGGGGSIARLAAAPDTPSEALSAIANMPVDSLVAEWQHRAHDGGIESESATPVVALGALAWIVVMGALSTRSSRWR